MDFTGTAAKLFDDKHSKLTMKLSRLAFGNRLASTCFIDFTVSTREGKQTGAHGTLLDSVVPDLFEAAGWTVTSPREGQPLGWDFKDTKAHSNSEYEYIRYYKEPSNANTMATALYHLSR